MRHRSPSLRAATWVALALFSLLSAPAAAQDVFLDQARRMHDRLVGLPPDPNVILQPSGKTVLQAMRDEIAPGGLGAEAAAEIAMTQPGFYNVVLKNWLIAHLREKKLEDVRGKLGHNTLRREIHDKFNEMLFTDGIERIQDVLFQDFKVQ